MLGPNDAAILTCALEWGEAGYPTEGEDFDALVASVRAELIECKRRADAARVIRLGDHRGKKP